MLTPFLFFGIIHNMNNSPHVIDPKELSDDELEAKISRAYNYLSNEIRYGHDAMIQSIEMTLAILEEEKEYRFLRRMEKEAEKERERKKSYDGPLNAGLIDGEEDPYKISDKKPTKKDK